MSITNETEMKNEMYSSFCDNNESSVVNTEPIVVDNNEISVTIPPPVVIVAKKKPQKNIANHVKLILTVEKAKNRIADEKLKLEDAKDAEELQKMQDQMDKDDKSTITNSGKRKKKESKGDQK